MQIIQLELDDWNFFCPVTGLKVFNDDGLPDASTFRAGWCHEVPDQPIHLAEVLMPHWQSYLDAQLAADDVVDIPAFLRSVELPNWVAFEITTSGMGCGPVGSKEWTVLELNSPDETEER